MRITKGQLKRIIREELRKRAINEAPTMARSLNDVSSVGEKVAIINQYDDLRNDYLDNQGSRHGKVMAKWRSHKSNGEKLTLVARAYVEKFEPRIHVLKLDLDDAQRAGDTREVKRLADDLFNIIYYENANLPINTGRFGKGGIGAAIGMVTGDRKIIMDTDMPLRRELIQIKNWLDQLKRVARIIKEEISKINPGRMLRENTEAIDGHLVAEVANDAYQEGIRKVGDFIAYFMDGYPEAVEGLSMRIIRAELAAQWKLEKAANRPYNKYDNWSAWD